MTKCSLIVIGSELTRGIIRDLHGQLVSKEMTKIGVHMSEIVAIPDDGSIEEILKALKKNNDIIIVTGGLGPTQDDMTRESIARVFNAELEEDEECLEELVKRVGKDKAIGANEKQAFIPKGFHVMRNPNGTAPGFYGFDDNTFVFALPGPPREMEPMFYSSVLPKVREILDVPDVKRVEFSSFITAEARLEELTEKYPSVEWGTRFQDYRISLYASANDENEVKNAISGLKEDTGPYRIVDGNKEALDLLIDELKSKRLTVSTAESCTGGLLASLLTSRSGSSEYFMGSVVSYSPIVKRDLLKVPSSIIEEHGVVSTECAAKMAEGALLCCQSDVAVSITGVAGPDKSEGKAPGYVCFGFAMKGRNTRSIKLNFTSWGRDSIRKRASVSAMLFLLAYIKGEDVEEMADKWRNI